MNRLHQAAVVVLALSAAACTGDPTSGGIFWSEAKAQKRQAGMMQEMNNLSVTARQEADQSAGLLARRRQLQQAQRKLSKLEREAPNDTATRDQLLREIQQYQRDINILKGTN